MYIPHIYHKVGTIFKLYKNPILARENNENRNHQQASINIGKSSLASLG
jgi:hypothetical protein